MSFHFLNSSGLYWHPGLSLVLDLVVPQPVPTHIRSPFFVTAAPKSRFRRAGGSGGRGHSFRRRLRPCFTFGSSCLDLPDLIRSRKIRIPSYDIRQAAALVFAPSIKTPWTAYFHKATSSFRAIATIADFLPRPPLCWTRSRNQTLSEEPGWCRNQSHAN